MAEVFLYNISGDKLKRIRTALIRLGIRGRQIVPAEYGHPIGYLAGWEGFSPAEKEYEGEGFRTEMLVMNGLDTRQFSSFLDALRASRATVALKAVVTESNAAWDSVTLRDALQEEHDTMREYIAAGGKKQDRSARMRIAADSGAGGFEPGPREQ
ncbi:MAG: DUF3783 domain-containing protein [Oscillospiraceae bacterium]|nr:DUF3783 domain-containing protein [Oscillospiraceae bacterium]